MKELTFEEFKNIVSAKFSREVWAFEVKTLSHPAFDYCTENVAEFTPTTYYSAKANHCKIEYDRTQSLPVKVAVFVSDVGNLEFRLLNFTSIKLKLHSCSIKFLQLSGYH